MARARRRLQRRRAVDLDVAERASARVLPARAGGHARADARHARGDLHRGVAHRPSGAAADRHVHRAARPRRPPARRPRRPAARAPRVRLAPGRALRARGARCAGAHRARRARDDPRCSAVSSRPSAGRNTLRGVPLAEAEISGWIAELGAAQPRQARDPLRGPGDHLRARWSSGWHGSPARSPRREAIAEGDRVAYLGRNAPELLDLLFACARLGAILVPLSARMPAPELEVVLAEHRAQGAARRGRRSRRRRARPRRLELRVIPFGGDGGRRRARGAARRRAGAALRSGSRRCARRC